MRLTAELIKDSLSYLNPLKERELDLRGHRIPAIENLGAAGPLDSIDLTDNDINILGNFPLSPRITTLLLARNRIASIQPTLPNSIPNLRHLVLASNQLAELSDLDVLAGLSLLTHVVLLDNPVAKKENYRYWVLWRCPGIRFLDYAKVKDAERRKAAELFGTSEQPTELASQIMGIKSKAVDMSGGHQGPAPTRLSRIKLTEKEKKRLREMIKNADSLQEIIRLEKMLSEGTLPPGVHIDTDAMEE
ncbi:U2 small nuclear ribonucleo protein A [Sodiomyces alkalinus F11]|uniref:U2 small nuclear ribonucleoprotein A' n=1 Tax=Sodiomyces alkalinus (strain CBS 110278 / VKM F-3762 / F11) TaxID=1314773 RepID=A0A3N2Q1R6_SODAK|nr:U2 small nuclear ribonucleo protein A [Sodiomyces alkalinus F11]ROT40628.1 U2 small nuclear ribonucleo protein A [Sodiomyces alkalinus F11]